MKAMGYRQPTEQPGHEAAERERRIDDHMAEASARRLARLRRLRRVDETLRIGRWLVALGAVVTGVLGLFAETREQQILALCLFSVVLFWWLVRLVARLLR